VKLLGHTPAWSRVLRRDTIASEPEVQVLKEALAGSDIVVSTGLILADRVAHPGR